MTWTNVSGQFTMAIVSVTTANELISMQAPTTMVGITSDPAEDITLLRVVGSYQVTMAGGAGPNWTLALIVQDTTWTPSATVSLDNDKRILWQRQYSIPALGTPTGALWTPPDVLTVTGTVNAMTRSEGSFLDITPKVRIEPGKALYLVAYEDGGAATFSVTSTSMRVLFKRSRRR